jgi:hypothetical protein
MSSIIDQVAEYLTETGRGEAARELREAIAAVHSLVSEQAEDEGLWFVADSIVEAYLQQELRRLHTLLETRLIGPT